MGGLYMGRLGFRVSMRPTPACTTTRFRCSRRPVASGPEAVAAGGNAGQPVLGFRSGVGDSAGDKPVAKAPCSTTASVHAAPPERGVPQRFFVERNVPY